MWCFGIFTRGLSFENFDKSDGLFDRKQQTKTQSPPLRPYWEVLIDVGKRGILFRMASHISLFPEHHRGICILYKKRNQCRAAIMPLTFRTSESGKSGRYTMLLISFIRFINLPSRRWATISRRLTLDRVCSTLTQK